MLVGEVRGILKEYTWDQLSDVITEMYKAIPKKVKEEKDIDGIIRDIALHKGPSKKVDAPPKDISDIDFEIEDFIDDAYNQYYFAPNSVIHKKERPKWRFKVKKYIKELKGFAVDSEDGALATDLLRQLYEVLSYSCARYIFSSDTPFRSAGAVQIELFCTVVHRILSAGINDESVRDCICIAVSNETDLETSKASIAEQLVLLFPTAEARTIAIKQCSVLKAELKKSPASVVLSKKHICTATTDIIKNIDQLSSMLNLALQEELS